MVNNIEYVTITINRKWCDFGEISISNQGNRHLVVFNSTKGIIAGGSSPGTIDNIDLYNNINSRKYRRFWRFLNLLPDLVQVVVFQFRGIFFNGSTPPAPNTMD